MLVSAQDEQMTALRSKFDIENKELKQSQTKKSMEDTKAIQQVRYFIVLALVLDCGILVKDHQDESRERSTCQRAKREESEDLPGGEETSCVKVCDSCHMSQRFLNARIHTLVQTRAARRAIAHETR